MPSWKTHLIFNSFVLLVWIVLLFDYNFIDNYFLLILLIIFSSFLSIFPDIDTWKSDIRNFFSFLFASILTVYFFFNMNFNSVVSLMVSFILIYILFRFFPTKHRGVTHKFWFSLFVSFILIFILWFIFGFGLAEFFIYFLLMLSGYFSHIFLDTLF
jgi:hypothetical protein